MRTGSEGGAAAESSDTIRSETKDQENHRSHEFSEVFSQVVSIFDEFVGIDLDLRSDGFSDGSDVT